MYAGIPKFPDLPAGLYRSEPTGPWTRVFRGNIRSLAVDPQEGTVYLDPARGALLRSHDWGDTWVPAGPTYGNRDGSVAIDPLDPDTLFAGAQDLLKSTDGGATWTVSQDGLLPGRWIQTLEGSASDPDLLMAGTTTGVFRSADGGASWIRASDGLPPLEVTALAVHPIDPGIAFAGVDVGDGFARSPLFRTLDGGASWRPIRGEIPRETAISELQFDPLHPNRVYAATSRGVLRSRDGGVSWDLRADGPPGRRLSPAVAFRPRVRFVRLGPDPRDRKGHHRLPSRSPPRRTSAGGFREVPAACSADRARSAMRRAEGESAEALATADQALAGGRPSRTHPCGGETGHRGGGRGALDLGDTAKAEELLGMVQGARPGQVTPFLRAHAAGLAAHLAALGGDADSVEPGFLAAEQGFRDLGTPRSTSR